MADIISETGVAIVGPLVNLVNSAVETIPGIVAAVIVLVMGYIIALAIGFVVKKAVFKLGWLNKYVKESSVAKVSASFDMAEFTGIVVKWYVFILFLSPAADLVKLAPLSIFLQKVALWLPNLIVAIIIAFLGLLGADYIALKIQGTKSKASSLVASGAKAVIIVFVAIIALGQVGIDVSIAESSFLLILAGIMLGLGLAFGLGGQENAKELLKRVKKNL